MAVIPKINKLSPEFMDDIEATVCWQYRMDKWKLQQKTRKREIVKVRQLCMALSKVYTTTSLAKIGERFGRKDHATVSHTIKTVDNLRETNLEFRGEYNELRRKIERRSHMVETGEHDTSLVCTQCGGKNIFTRIWINANTGKITNEDIHDDILNNWCEDCQDHVELKQRCELYRERKDLERHYKRKQELKKYNDNLQAIRDEFDD